MMVEMPVNTSVSGGFISNSTYCKPHLSFLPETAEMSKSHHGKVAVKPRGQIYLNECFETIPVLK